MITESDLPGVMPDEMNTPSPAKIVSDEIVKPMPPDARVLTTGTNSVLIGVAPPPVSEAPEIPEVIEPPLEEITALDSAALSEDATGATDSLAEEAPLAEIVEPPPPIANPMPTGKVLIVGPNVFIGDKPVLQKPMEIRFPNQRGHLPKATTKAVYTGNPDGGIESIFSPMDVVDVMLEGTALEGIRDYLPTRRNVVKRMKPGVKSESSVKLKGGNTKTRLPRENGKWDGKSGEGNWHSDLDEVNKVTGGKPIPFKKGRPGFSEWSKGEVAFKKGELNGTNADFSKVYEKIAKEKGLKNKTAAKKLLKEKGLTPHHLDDRTIQLIPSKLHGNIPHVGSASDMRNMK